MQITHVDDFVLADNDLEAFVTRAEGNAYGASFEMRQRSRLYPIIEDVNLDESTRTIYIQPVDGAVASQADVEAFNLLVRRVFAPSIRSALLTGTWNGMTYQNRVWFRGNARPQPNYWEVDVVAANPTWESTTLNTITTSPLAVGGNAPAQPLITLSGGGSCTRHRVLVTDRTGHGIGSYLIATPVVGATTANTVVYHNGLSVPFDVAVGHVFVRVGTRLGRVGILDIYSGTAITNTSTGGALDPGGLTLDADVVNGIYKPAIEDPFEHPLSAALSWHPGIVTKHDNGRAYTFGWDGTRLNIVDRESTGVKRLHDDDMDAIVLTSPVGLQSINVPGLTLRAGYREGRFPAGGDITDGPRSLRVTIATLDGEAQPADGWTFQSNGTKSTGDGASSTKALQTNFPGTGTERNHFTQWTFGENTFPEVRTYQITDHFGYLVATSDGTKVPNNGSVGYTGSIVSPWDFPTIAAQYIGADVVNGPPGVYYLDFPAGAYRGAELPGLTMDIQPLDVSLNYQHSDGSTNSQRHTGSTAWVESMVFEVVEVDPITREPLDDPDGDAITDQPLIGKARVSIWSRARDSEDWTRRWTSTLSGTPDEVVMSFGRETILTGGEEVLAPGVVALEGDTQVAIGLEPSASDPNHIEWSELEIATGIVVTTVSGERPTISSASVAAQRIHGDLVNTETGERITFINVLSDATGLEVDTSQVGTERAVQGAGGVGPWYGDLQPSGGARLFDLDPDTNNAWTSPVTTTEFVWRDRVAW